MEEETETTSTVNPAPWTWVILPMITSNFMRNVFSATATFFEELSYGVAKHYVWADDRRELIYSTEETLEELPVNEGYDESA